MRNKHMRGLTTIENTRNVSELRDSSPTSTVLGLQEPAEGAGALLRTRTGAIHTASARPRVRTSAHPGAAHTHDHRALRMPAGVHSPAAAAGSTVAAEDLHQQRTGEGKYHQGAPCKPPVAARHTERSQDHSQARRCKGSMRLARTQGEVRMPHRQPAGLPCPRTECTQPALVPRTTRPQLPSAARDSLPAPAGAARLAARCRHSCLN